MPKINILPFSVANLIAAGEVVDRPASVVKELMENAIDAGATSITVEIQHGGVTFLRVSDNGCGMEPEDLPVAVCRHATSKIREAADLDGILTLGFRGEALAATAAVSEMRIISKVANADFGAVLTVSGGEVVSLEEQGCSNGTTVIVENLFFNVPARRKFLKRDATEAMAVGINVEKVALSHPEIAFRFISDGSVKLETSGDGKLKSAIYAVYGKDFASRMIYVEGGNESIRVEGCISRPDNVKTNRNYQNYFLNGRYVRSKTACAAVEQAYVSFLPPEKFPCCVLYLTLNPTAVDVNVHPAKLEVKFSNEKPVFEAIYYTVRAALEENRVRPEMKLSAMSRPAPAERMTAEEYRSRSAAASEKRMTNAFVPVEDRVSGPSPVKQLQITDPPLRTSSQAPVRPTSASPVREAPIREQTVSPIRMPAPEKAVEKPAVPPQRRAVPSSAVSPEEKAPLAEPVQPTPPLQVPRAEKPQAISENPAPPPAPVIPTEPIEEVSEKAPEAGELRIEIPVSEEHALPTYRIIGEAFHSYVLVERYDNDNPVLLLVDKHAAHERIIFEQLKARMQQHGIESSESASQILMFPVEFMLTASEIEVLKQYKSEIEAIGFAFEAGVHTVRVSEIPGGIEQDAVESFFGVVAGRLLDQTGDVVLTRDILFEKALYQGACKAAIKAGRAYVDEHVDYIIKCLMEIPDITFCPHGRPVAMELSKKKIDHQFKRS